MTICRSRYRRISLSWLTAFMCLIFSSPFCYWSYLARVHSDDRVHVRVRLLDGAENPRTQLILLGSAPPDGRVQFDLLGYAALPAHSTHVSQLPRSNSHGQPHHQGATDGDLLHTGTRNTLDV